MSQLVAFRVVQGVGAGGLVPLALSTVGGLVPPRERGRYQGLIGATFAAAAIGGPPLGGVIVDTIGWRWIFLVNLPLAMLALVAIWVAMPHEPRRRERSIDWFGAAVLAAGSSALLLGLVWGGHEFPWSSAEVVGVLAAAAALLVAFALLERRVPETILPFEILRNRTAGVATLALALLGMTILGTIVYVPLFVQGVLDRSATSAGVIVVPFMLSAVCASVASGWWVSRTGRYKANAVVGLAVLAAGLLLVWRMDEATGGGEVARNAVVAGLGVGLAMQVLIVAVQNTVVARDDGLGDGTCPFLALDRRNARRDRDGRDRDARPSRRPGRPRARSRSTCRSSSATSSRSPSARRSCSPPASAWRRSSSSSSGCARSRCGGRSRSSP